MLDDKQMSHHLEHQVSKCSVTVLKCPNHPIGGGSLLGGNLTEVTQSEKFKEAWLLEWQGRMSPSWHPLQSRMCSGASRPRTGPAPPGLQRRGLLRPIHAYQTTKHTAFSRMPADVFKMRNIFAN